MERVTAAMSRTRKPIKNYDYYPYLQDHKLRTKEKRIAVLVVEDADFEGEQFIGGIWRGFTFKNCRFPVDCNTQLKEMVGCYFHFCEFGSNYSGKMLDFGKASRNRFLSCKFKNCNISFGEGSADFTDCRFDNNITKSHSDASFFLSGDSVKLVDCKIKNYKLMVGTRLHMKRCDFKGVGYGIATSISNSEGNNTIDHILENSHISVAESIFWNVKLNSFTIRNCKIPLLRLNQLQTSNLVIKNCKFDQLDLKKGCIGNLTIKNTWFGTLDLSNTLATKYDIDAASAASGQIVSEESDYPKGGAKVE
jgi:uncharacterized protein YjbI with pentapeptide repeats